MLSRRALPLLAWSWFAGGCVGSQNFDDGESELNNTPEETQTSLPSDAGHNSPGSDTAQPLTPGATESSVVEAGPAAPVTPPTATQSPSALPSAEPSLPPSAAPEDAGSVDSPPETMTEDVADSGPSTAGEELTVTDSGGAAGAGNGETADAGLGATCEVDACNDHGTCIERGLWTICDCEAAQLPVCELPLFREIGRSRSNAELLLVTISGDGTTLVGAHAESGSEEEWVGVKWTLDGGLEVLPQHPAGPTVANRVNHDGSLIKGYVEPTAGGDPFDVIWRNGELALATLADQVPGTNGLTPTLEELYALMEDAGVDASSWDIWNVNAASADGKVIFGLGISPTYGARWLLRLP